MKLKNCKKCFFFYQCIIQIGKNSTEIPLFNCTHHGIKRKMFYLCSKYGNEIKKIQYCFDFKK